MEHEIVIIVEDGRVQSVLGSTKYIDVEVIDLDTDDPERYEEAKAAYDEAVTRLRDI